MTSAEQTPSLTVFKSAFGHSLRTSQPIPVPEHLAHLTVSVIAGQYVFKVHGGPKLSLELSLPDYSSEKNEEGEIVYVPSDTQVPEEGKKMLEQIKNTTNPASMVLQNSRGALYTMFEYVCAQRELISNTQGIVDLKHKSCDLITKALEEVKTNAEALSGRTIVEMDEVISGAERTILTGLLDACKSNSVLAEYFEKLIQLHSDLALDTSIDSDPPMECCGGGCCGEASSCGAEGDCKSSGCCDEGECGANSCHDHDDHQQCNHH